MKVIPGDPGFENVEIRLDGVWLEDAVEADDCAGWVKVYRRDPVTQALVFDVTGDSYVALYDILEGSVQITSDGSLGPLR